MNDNNADSRVARKISEARKKKSSDPKPTTYDKQKAARAELVAAGDITPTLAESLNAGMRPTKAKQTDSLDAITNEILVQKEADKTIAEAGGDTSGSAAYLNALSKKRAMLLQKKTAELGGGEQAQPAEGYPAAEFGWRGNVKNAEQQHEYVRKVLGRDPLAPKAAAPAPTAQDAYSDSLADAILKAVKARKGR